MLRWIRGNAPPFSETLRELANLAAAALILGQFVGDARLSWLAIAAGAAIWGILVTLSVALLKENES